MGRIACNRSTAGVVKMRPAAETVRHVLFVDDEPSIGTLVGYALEFSGYVVLTAHNGGDALKLYAAHHDELDVVVVDYILPDMRGDQLVARMCEIDGAVPFVCMSGHNPQDIAPELRRRASVFLHKPFNLASLSERLDEAVLGVPA